MFYMVCASTPQSSVRVACAGVLEAQAKIVELEEAAVGKVRIFDHTGKRLSDGELSDLVALEIAKEQINASPPGWLMTTRRPGSTDGSVE